MYMLHADQSRLILRVSEARPFLRHLSFTNDVLRYERNYYVCLQREPLLRTAEALKRQWVMEKETEIAFAGAHRSELEDELFFLKALSCS